jgi:hypothetical protein
MNRQVYSSILGLVFLTLSVLAGCGGGSSSTPPVESIAATSGTPQSATVGTAFAALVATVVDNGSTPVSGVTVTFTAPATGTGASGTFANGTNTTTATTDTNGNASLTFTANMTAGGPYTVTASSTGVSTIASFSLTNMAGTPASIAVTSGSTPQSTMVNTAFADPLVAMVADSDSNPISDATVTFTAPTTGASGTFANGTNTTTVTTDTNGNASATFTGNGTAGGPYVVTATTGVLTPANFNLTNTAMVVEMVTATGGTPQSTEDDTAFATPLTATVMAGGSPVSGVTVTFTAPPTGASGTFAGGVNTATTNANGVATSATFSANGILGNYTVTATVMGGSGPAAFSLTNTVGAPASITVTSGTPQSATIDMAFAAPLVATVLDKGSNPVSGVTVTFTAPTTGPSGTFAGGVNTATTNVSGVATSTTFTANGTAGGPYTVAATVSGVLTPANFSLTNTAGAPASIAATSGTPQSAAINMAFAAALGATVLDKNSNPVSGATVTFTAPTTGATGTFPNGTNTVTAQTGTNGIAISTTFTANGTAGGPYTVTATVPGVSTPANFSLTNTAGAPASITATSGTPQSTIIDTAFVAPLVATVLDKNSNAVSGATVTFTAPATGATGTFANGTSTTTATTNASGVATSTTFSANGTAGAYTVTATVAGVTAPADFSLTNTAGAPASIAATGGTPQSTVINTAFSAPLGATVLDKGSNPVSGVTVTFTAPTTGAAGTFVNGTNTTTATTSATGVATSSTFSSNGTVGGPYTVTATVAGASTPADFSLTNTAAVGASTNYSFYVSGLEELNDGPNSYALAGSLTIDSNGTVVGGEQDYNDGFGLHSPAGGDKITGGTLTVNAATGQGTLTLITNNANLGVSGTEILGVQFVNTKHALVVQFDGTATSSGSMDAQTLSSTLNDGNYAFTLSGVDTLYFPIVFGGVFQISDTGTKLTGVYDVDDPNNLPTVETDQAFTGTISIADPSGRGTISGANLGGINMSLVYYIVGPEVIRIIDVDASDMNVGSAFGQGTGTFSNASLGPSVFGVDSGSGGINLFAAAGMFTTGPAMGTFQGVGDDNEIYNAVSVSGSPISGTYSIANNGYGSLKITAGLGDVSDFGIYMTDPALNLNDPNNTTSGLGGALIADLDDGDDPPGLGFNGTGLVVPQTDTKTTSFAGNYAFGAQDYNVISTTGWEFDFVGQGSVTDLALNGTGLVSDPFSVFSSNVADTGVAFSGTAIPDASNAGRYTIPLSITVVTGSPVAFPAAIYQAGGGQLFWLNVGIDNDAADGVFLGPLEQQGR